MTAGTKDSPRDPGINNMAGIRQLTCVNSGVTTCSKEITLYIADLFRDLKMQMNIGS
jgi:hypothetical protein